MAAGCQKYICNSSRSACTLTKEAFHMLKKNTRKRLLAGALATVMMLTMCPSWALADNLADDEGIATLPANEEIAVPVDDSTPAADTTETPAVPTPSEPEAKPAEGQDPAPAPSDGGANGGTDSTESGNSTNPTVSKDSENNSQNSDTVSNSPENEISMASLDIDLASNRNTKAQYFVLLPNRDKPTSGKSQGRASYLPNKTSDGGVTGRNAEKGYEGYLTPEGKKIAKDNYNIHDAKNGYTKIDGVESEYLEPPTNLGFFTKANWSEDGKTYNEKSKTTDPFSVLGENFNVNNIRVVWYTIKRQIDGYHVDGYVAGVPVKVTYHTNYAKNGITGMEETFEEVSATSGETYTVRDNTFTVPTGFHFDGWYTDKDCTKEYQTTTLMTSLDLYAKWTTNSTPVEPETETPAKYFVLLPTRSAPENNDDQGEEFYLPSSKSNGGVSDLDQSTGYVGSLTKEGMDVVSKVGDSVTDTVNGVSKSYLKVPTDLGFFTPGNWNEDGTYNDPLADTSILGDNFNVNDIKIVWYTIKNQGMKDDKLDIHVDGYVKNVAINVTYHSNFGTDATYNDGTKTGTNYTALDYSKTGLPTRDGYEFRGWYTDTACETPYTAKVLMTGLHLYAKWVPTNSNVSYFYQNEQGTETQFGDIDTYAFGTDVTVRTAHPEKEGYTFTGWTNIANIVTVDADGKFTMPAQDVRFDAQFSINQYHVTYKVDGKDYGNTETYVFNSDVAIRPVPTKEGYTFSGWKIGTADAENFKMPAHDVTIEGTFAINRYTVTYKVDTEVVGTDVYDFNSDVVIRDVPTKEGYTFSGWKIGTADAENFKMPAHDVIIEGTFAKNSSGHHHRKPTVTIPDKVPTGLNGNDHYAYIVGYPDKTVRPQNGITRAEVATIFFRLLTDETRNANSTKSNSYSDVAAGAWYNHAVSTLSAMGIVKGDSNGKFNPNAPITRAEFAAIAARFDDKANSTTADFSDIVSHWAKNEISAASNNGWINGYPDGTFRPDNKITRAEAMTLVNRVLKRLPETAEDLHDDMIKWSDNSDASQWFYLAVQEATNSHYYKAKENKFEKWSELRDTRDWTELEK